MSDLYDADILQWSELHALLLSHRQAVRAMPKSIDGLAPLAGALGLSVTLDDLLSEP